MWYRSFWLQLTLALAFGAIVLWVATRPTWEGSGIDCWMIILASVFLGYLNPARAWLLSLAVTGWVAAFGLLNGNPPALFALVVGFVGAFVGSYTRRLVRSIAR